MSVLEGMLFTNLETAAIRVLVVDASAVTRMALARIVASHASLRVCGTAGTGPEALEKIRQLQPDVITLDLDLPLPDGLQALEGIMREFPRPVIVLSSLEKIGAEAVMRAWHMGAFDCLPKGTAGQCFETGQLEYDVIARIEAAAQSRLQHRRSITGGLRAFPGHSECATSETGAKLVVIGASTGGPSALEKILPELPADLPASIVIVQHMPPGFTQSLAERLDGLSKLSVREARDGDTLDPGCVLIAPAGLQTTVFQGTLSKAMISLSEEPAGAGHCPSVDVCMVSAAKAFGRHAAGLILTGIGSDGLAGMTSIHQAGGMTIGQDENTSVVYGMPRCCAEAGVLGFVAPLSLLPSLILKAADYRRKFNPLEADLPEFRSRRPSAGQAGSVPDPR
jgi:two-component system chemotaxis response regulator CheB